MSAHPPPPRQHMLESEARDTRLRCPKDATLMEKSTVRGMLKGEPRLVIIDRCALCGAVWFDRTELEAIIEMKLAHKVDLGPFNTERQGGGRGSTAVGGMTCPRDASILVQVEHTHQRHVLIDICTDCGGTLLDAGELLDLAEFSVMERIKAALGRA